MRRPALLAAHLVLALALHAGCAPGGGPSDGGDPPQDGGADDGGGGPSDAGPRDSGWPPPDDDLVDPLGTPTTLDVGTWNVENFPATSTTPSLVADLVASMAIDLFALEEIADVDAFEELVGRLPEHEAVLSPDTYGDGSYQKIAFVYRAGVLELLTSSLLFTDLGFVFPRPALRAQFRYDDGDGTPVELEVIAVHLKAGTGSEDSARRREAIAALEQYVRGVVDAGQPNVIVLGDFNETFTRQDSQLNWAPFLDAPERYVVHTVPLAQADQETFLPSGSILDHIVTTTGLDDEIAGQTARIPRLDQAVSSYQSRVSDHLPVTLSFSGT